MKRGRFSEEQSIHYRQRIAKQCRQRVHPEGASGQHRGQGALPEAWHKRWHVLKVALEVWGHGSVCGQTVESA